MKIEEELSPFTKPDLKWLSESSSKFYEKEGGNHTSSRVVKLN